MSMTPCVKYLVMVTSANNNKYYKMIPNGNEFKVEYGRLGMPNFQTASYPISQFKKKYDEKIRKGYVDKTELIEELVTEEKPNDKKNVEYKPISDEVVAKIVERLQEMARKTIEANYKVSSNMVSQKMVDESQECLNRLTRATDVNDFNEILLQNFSIISRRMGHVSDWLASSSKDFENIITREQNLLDVMAGQVKQHAIDKKNAEKSNADETKEEPKSNKTILAAMGISIRKVTKKEETEIKKLLGENASRYVNAWKVTNNKTQKAFDKHLEELGEETEVKQLWHGSRNENWWSIITTGLVLRPTNAIISGKMFGYGIYFAPDAAKSMGYTSQMNSCHAHGTSKTGFLSLYDVIYGDPYIVDKNYYSYNGLGQLTYESLQKIKPGANSLHALKGVTGLLRDEIIVYKESQATIKYLVEVEA